jgi:hypothetical protein
VTITALVRVSESCGSTATSKLRQTFAQLGTTTCGMPGVIANSDAMRTSPVAHPATIAAASASGAAGQRGTRVRANSSVSDPKPKLRGFEDQPEAQHAHQEAKPELKPGAHRLRDRAREATDPARDPEHEEHDADYDPGSGDLARPKAAVRITAEIAFIGSTGSGSP